MWDVGHLNMMKCKTLNLEVATHANEIDSVLTFMQIDLDSFLGFAWKICS